MCPAELLRIYAEVRREVVRVRITAPRTSFPEDLRGLLVGAGSVPAQQVAAEYGRRDQ